MNSKSKTGWSLIPRGFLAWTSFIHHVGQYIALSGKKGDI